MSVRCQHPLKLAGAPLGGTGEGITELGRHYEVGSVDQAWRVLGWQWKPPPYPISLLSLKAQHKAAWICTRYRAGVDPSCPIEADETSPGVKDEGLLKVK